jgi:hypothetical protein
MPIINSVIKTSQPQQNGTLLVHEQHTDQNGVIYDHVWNAPADADIELTAQLRGANIGVELDRRAAAAAEAHDFEIPLTIDDIIKRLDLAELAAFYASTDPNVGVARIVFDRWSGPVYRSDALTQQLFGVIQAAGILSAERVAEVLA